MRNLNRRSLHGRAEAGPHPIYSKVLDKLPERTRWAVASGAEFRADGLGDMRGVLHHDGAVLRYTSWGGTERFAAAPMEFDWHLSEHGLFTIATGHQRAWFMRLEHLSFFVEEPPPFAASHHEPLDRALASWLRTWTPAAPLPLTSTR